MDETHKQYVDITKEILYYICTYTICDKTKNNN